MKAKKLLTLTVTLGSLALCSQLSAKMACCPSSASKPAVQQASAEVKQAKMQYAKGECSMSKAECSDKTMAKSDCSSKKECYGSEIAGVWKNTDKQATLTLFPNGKFVFLQSKMDEKSIIEGKYAVEKDELVFDVKSDAKMEKMRYALKASPAGLSLGSEAKLKPLHNWAGTWKFQNEISEKAATMIPEDASKAS